MESFCTARNLRDLMGVAVKLRALADAETRADDRALYRDAAEALEAKAGQMAQALPGEKTGMRSTHLHQRVDLLI